MDHGDAGEESYISVNGIQIDTCKSSECGLTWYYCLTNYDITSITGNQILVGNTVTFTIANTALVDTCTNGGTTANV